MRRCDSNLEDGVTFWDVEADTIDNVTSGCDAIRLVKMDLEGAEMLALHGMERTLETKAPTVLVEVTDKFLREIKGDADSLYGFLESKGYSAYIVGDRSVQRADRAPAVELSNMVFAKNPSDIAILEDLNVA